MADPIDATPIGVNTQPMPLVFDDEAQNDPWACAGADAGPPEDPA